MNSTFTSPTSINDMIQKKYDLLPQPSNSQSTFTVTRTLLLAAGLLALSACSSSNNSQTGEVDVPGTDNPPLGSGEDGQYAFVATRASDYGSGRIDRVSLDDGNVVDGQYPSTGSDIRVTTDGSNLYQIGRFSLNSVTQFSPLDTSTPLYQYSVNDDDTADSANANPYSIVFVDQTKAYLTRRGSDKLWIVNPSAASAEEFKIGEIDLGAYDTDLPDMTDAILVDNKLFVLVERLNQLPSFSQIPDKNGFLVVIDTLNDMEIDTNQSVSDLKGIELLVTNPTALQYNNATGEIYVVGRGNYYENSEITADFHSGGIQAIDPTTYEHTLLLDDGTDDDNQGYFVDAEIVNAQLGYLLTYKAFGSTTLRTFNPTTGLLSNDLIEGFQDVDITLIEEGPDNHLWVGINDATPGFFRIDLSTGELDAEKVRTELVPSDITFIQVTEEQ